MEHKYKAIYKKTLAFDLVKLGHDLSHTERNKFNPKFQVFYFPRTKELMKDFAWLTEHHHNSRKNKQDEHNE